ncbi:MAG: hypothetical protein HY078_06640 [Elusimicrobia bacterium]|nr:hypothetical protein [Elusimicrobiota bacterium]
MKYKRPAASLKEPGSEQAPMGAHPPEAPKLDQVLIDAYQATQPPGFRDNPESAVEAADIDVLDTIGGE